MGHVRLLEQRGRTPVGAGSGLLDGPGSRLCGLSVRTWLGLVLLLALLAPVVFTVWRGPTFFDDAYMFHRYALHVRDGLGIAWNPDGVQTYGLTSHAWLLAVLAFSYLPVAPGTMLQLASATAAAAAMLIMGLAVSRHAKTSWLRDPVVATSAACLPLLGSAAFAYHLTSGMDTMLSMAMHGALILTVLRYMAEPRLSLAVLAGLTAFAAVLTRPENGLCALGVPALTFLAMWRWDRWRDLGGLIVLPVVLIATELLVCWLVFGTPLPLSFYAKSLHAYAGFQNPENAVKYMALATSIGLIYVPLLIASARRRDAGFLLALLLPVLATFAYLATMRQVMGWMGRYYVPFLPYLIVPAVLLIDRAMADHDLRRDLPRRLCAAVAIVAAIVCVWTGARGSMYAAYMKAVVPPPIAVPALTFAAKAPLPKVEWHDANVTLAEKVAAHLPKGAVMAASEVGYLGSMARHASIIDLVGLNDTTIGRRGFSMDYLLSRKPDLIWLPHDDYTGLRAKILSDGRLFEQYDVLAGAFTYGLAIRRDSVHRGAVETGVRDAWTAVYPGREMKDYVVPRAFSTKVDTGLVQKMRQIKG